MSDDRYRVWLAKAPPSPRCPASGWTGVVACRADPAARP